MLAPIGGLLTLPVLAPVVARLCRYRRAGLAALLHLLTIALQHLTVLLGLAIALLRLLPRPCSLLYLPGLALASRLLGLALASRLLGLGFLSFSRPFLILRPGLGKDRWRGRPRRCATRR